MHLNFIYWYSEVDKLKSAKWHWYNINVSKVRNSHKIWFLSSAKPL